MYLEETAPSVATFRQNPEKCGIKVWIVIDAETAYCCYLLHTGKIGNQSEQNQGDRVVKDIASHLLDGGTDPKGRTEYTSEFAFAGKLTICSYIPKKNRVVIMLSSMHNDNIIDINSPQKKPEIFLC